jgi:hypothetical protein
MILNYDAVADQLVLVFSEEGDFEAITPDIELVSSFRIPDATFIRVIQDSVGPLTSGYYELLYDGPTRVLSKRKKEIVSANEKDYLSRYATAHQYFVRVNGIYYQIRSRNALLNLFPEQKKDLKTFTRENRLLYKDSPARYITKTAEYLDSK